MQQVEEGHNRYEFYISLASFIIFCTVASLLALHILRHPLSLIIATPLLILSLVLAMATADFASGIVHWFFDRYGCHTTPFFGTQYIFPFREHHLYPQKIAHHNFIITNGDTGILPSLMMGGYLLFEPIASSPPLNFFISSFIFSLGCFAAFTNQIHKWAYQSKPPPKWVRFLQRFRIILSPQHHSVHHRDPFDTYYCITTGWLNPLLRKVHFFVTLESLIFKIFSIKAGDYDLQVLKDIRPKRH